MPAIGVGGMNDRRRPSPGRLELCPFRTLLLMRGDLAPESCSGKRWRPGWHRPILSEDTANLV